MLRNQSPVPRPRRVRAEVRRLCERLNVEPPKIRFRESGDGWYDRETVWLPDPVWALEGQPDLSGVTYWLLVAHEVAHYVSDKYHSQPYHSPIMYATLFTVILMWDLPLDRFYVEEHSYCPSSFRASRRLVGNLLARNLTGLRPVDSVLPTVTERTISEGVA